MKQMSKTPQVRCAIYTRKSTEEGLDQDFNTLDAQRESGEAFIASQKHDGWVLVPDRYDDGGYTGANMERPAIQRLLADIEAGKVDIIVVYKIDRLSRSLLDFARMMEILDRHHVSFVSVTQQFNTATSMGRLVLNMLLSFAQFEREMISERTRDKIAATRRKGKWTGGMPLLGYDVVDTKLVVKHDEAERVRQIFELYLEQESLLSTVKELTQRGWSTKSWTTRKGVRRGGIPIGKTKLHQLLTNVTYLGKIRYKDEVHEGEHEAIVDADTFRCVQETLSRGGVKRGAGTRNKQSALLTGLLRCAACDCAMVHTYTTKGNRRYRYYVCASAQQRGWRQCPAPSVPAAEIERFVVDEIRGIGCDPQLVAATLAETALQFDEAARRLKREQGALTRQLRDDLAALDNGAGSPMQHTDTQSRVDRNRRRASEVATELERITGYRPTPDDVRAALAEFDGIWAKLTHKEQGDALALLIDRVELDGPKGVAKVTFRPTGIFALGNQMCCGGGTAA